jgi:hypothetical protein
MMQTSLEDSLQTFTDIWSTLQILDYSLFQPQQEEEGQEDNEQDD